MGQIPRSTERILSCSGNDFVVHTCLLFTAMLKHSFVPTDFKFEIIIPVLKDKHGDMTSIDMYRGITLTPV